MQLYCRVHSRVMLQIVAYVPFSDQLYRQVCWEGGGLNLSSCGSGVKQYAEIDVSCITTF